MASRPGDHQLRGSSQQQRPTTAVRSSLVQGAGYTSSGGDASSPIDFAAYGSSSRPSTSNVRSPTTSPTGTKSPTTSPTGTTSGLKTQSSADVETFIRTNSPTQILTQRPKGPPPPK
eukprot:1727230-Pyramimonas_sp.AAC.1